MSHHASGPEFGFPRGDARLDMTDLYAFPKPGDPGKSILVLNVHPSVGVNPPGPTTKEPFAPGALYEFKIDTDDDAVADIAYNGEVIVEAAPGLGREGSRGDDSRRLRSDPFFFDANGFFNKMQFTGDDFFSDKNVCSIVLEVPNSALGTNVVGLWARTLEKTREGWIQADRGGRPMQAVFLPGESREAYLDGEPAHDDRFIGVFAHELEHSGGYTAEDAVDAARKLLPDVLPYDPRRPARFPDNGRTLTDDVVDAFFSMLTNGRVTGDKVGAHGDLLNEFPYLGPPHD